MKLSLSACTSKHHQPQPSPQSRPPKGFRHSLGDTNQPHLNCAISSFSFMSAASLGTVVLSARSLALRRLPLPRPSYCSPLHGPTASQSHSTLTTAMLGQANKKFEATKRNDLVKQLFPSSSPGASQNANIADLLKRPNHPPAPVPPMPPAAPSSTSFSHPQNSLRTSSMASLYSQSNSFSDEPQQTMSTLGGAQSKPVVFFNEDDFSDDDTLDFQLPTVLPTLPKPPPPPPPHVPKERIPPPSTQTETAIPWSSSPASHMVHPLSRHTSTASRTLSNTSSLKREPQDRPETPQQRPAKKRSLPKGWKDDPINLDEDEDEEMAAQAQARKLSRQDSLPWNATASAVKAQKKQLKNQGKKADEDDAMASVALMEQAIMAHHAVVPKEKTLSSEQRKVLDLVVDKGQSVFFTGPAGTGKSFLMENIINHFKKKFARDPERLAVTASTGLAACHIGGITLHSFAGIGLGKDPVPQLLKRIRRNAKVKTRWLKTKVLIIDEVSMVDGELFDKLSSIGRTLRNNGRPWGGIQLVITGDFFQLPPVPDTGPDSKKKESKFAFDADTWSTSIDHTIGLTQVFRQKDPGRPSLVPHLHNALANQLQFLPACSTRCASVESATRRSRPSRQCHGPCRPTTPRAPRNSSRQGTRWRTRTTRGFAVYPAGRSSLRPWTRATQTTGTSFWQA